MPRLIFAILSASMLSSCDYLDTGGEDNTESTFICGGEDEIKNSCNNCDLLLDWSNLDATDDNGSEVSPDNIMNVTVMTVNLSADVVYQNICGDDINIHNNVQEISMHNTSGNSSLTIPVAVDDESSLIVVLGNDSFTQYVYIEPLSDSSNSTISL